MGADEKHAATYHGGEYTPATESVRNAYVNDLGAWPTKEDQVRFFAEFDRWLETVRAEAKAEALLEADEAWNFGPDIHEPFGAWLRARANQYKENLS